MNKISGFLFIAKVAGFLMSIAGDRELTADDLHKAIEHVRQYIDKDGDGVVLELTDADKLKTLTAFIEAVNNVVSDGELSIADLHKIVDNTAEHYFATNGKHLSFKF